MNILVTGGAGYKGVKLVKKLLDFDYRVTLFDNFMYGYEPVLHLVENKNLEVEKGDIRNGIKNIQKYDVVFHLAGISGFPACEANQTSAQQINVEATKRLVSELGKGQYLINASTTSFYGKSGDICTEESIVDPVSMYGTTKYLAEQIISERENSVNLRFATIFGPSPKLRLDLMVNDFTYRAVKEGVVVLFDSYAKRTFMHIDDAIDCYLFALDNIEKMKGQVYNAGGESLNYSKLEIANIVKKFIDFKIIDSDIKDRDVRHFIVSYNKISSLGFSLKRTVEDGVSELIKLFKFYDSYSHFKTI
ncbi:MAG: NAD(P)-dependent oxidoreductase [Bacteroidota bacterium]